MCNASFDLELSIDVSHLYMQKAWGNGYSLLGVLYMCNRLTKVIMAHSAVSYIERGNGKVLIYTTHVYRLLLPVRHEIEF